MSKIRVVLADDHPLAREGLRNLLAKAINIEVVGEAVDGNQTLDMVNTLQPDVLLLDMEMPGMKGVTVAQQLQNSQSKVRVLALSAYDDQQYIKGLLASGAAGYLMKEEASEAIIEAVQGVARGEEGWLSRRVAAKLSSWAQQQRNLTPREMDVLRLVVGGQTNQEIGFKLGISEKTVEKHLDSIFTKLDVSSRVEAAVWAVREGVV